MSRCETWHRPVSRLMTFGVLNLYCKIIFNFLWHEMLFYHLQEKNGTIFISNRPSANLRKFVLNKLVDRHAGIKQKISLWLTTRVLWSFMRKLYVYVWKMCPALNTIIRNLSFILANFDRRHSAYVFWDKPTAVFREEETRRTTPSTTDILRQANDEATRSF